jgi:hypothetical protein
LERFLARSETMPDGQGDDECLLAQHNTPDRRIFAFQATEANVDPSLFERLQLLHRRQLVKADLHRLEAVAETPDDLGQKAVQGRSHEADGEFAVDLTDAPRHRFQVRSLVQQLLRMRMEELSGFSQA